MEIKNNYELFKEIFANPDLADGAIVSNLTEQYPYVNTLWFIRARVAIIKQDKNADFHIQKAALFTPNIDLLTQYIYKEAAIQTKNHEYAEDIYIEDEESGEEKQRKNKRFTIDTITEKEHPTGKNDETPSRYHDNLMPYTFLWWLQKTRSDHSETYQPYVRPNQQSLIKDNGVSSKKDLLDQQIRENIFHLQSPEQKLSTSFSGETIPFKVPKKENPIIERFIKEEPQIKPPSPERINLENKARQSAEDESGFVSETLAIIYSEQGLYHKALDTYKKLSLKFPEKSLYFADRINELTNKIN